jgi:hypothetical protein
MKELFSFHEHEKKPTTTKSVQSIAKYQPCWQCRHRVNRTENGSFENTIAGNFQIRDLYLKI